MGESQKETLLVENKNRFVIFPIKYNKVSNFYTIDPIRNILKYKIYI